MRPAANPGTRFSPDSSIWFISARVISQWSGSSVGMSVVPMTLTVLIGTRMSPSAGISHRFTTVCTSRWLAATMIPLPGLIWTWQPARAAMRPPQAPAALTVTCARICTCPPSGRLATMPVTRSPSLVTVMTSW